MHFGQQLKALEEAKNISPSQSAPRARRTRFPRNNKRRSDNVMISLTPSLGTLATPRPVSSVLTASPLMTVDPFAAYNGNSSNIQTNSRSDNARLTSSSYNILQDIRSNFTASYDSPIAFQDPDQDTVKPTSDLRGTSIPTNLNRRDGYYNHLPPANPLAIVNIGPPQRLPDPFADLSVKNLSKHLAPRAFSNGKLIPREEDVVWCLEIISHILKETGLQEELYGTRMLPCLSSREKCDPNFKHTENFPPLCLKAESKELAEISTKKVKDDLAKTDEDVCYESCDDGNQYAKHWNYEDYDFESMKNDVEEEYTCSTFNAYPMIEQFTTESYSNEMRHWSGLIMRDSSCHKTHTYNYCGVAATVSLTKCGNFNCDAWETKSNEFGKCEKCFRIKYCSEKCFKNASPTHESWCIAPNLRVPRNDFS